MNLVMLFVNEKACSRLLTKGSVVTFRHQHHRVGRDWFTDKRGGKKIADIDIEQIGRVYRAQDLAPYLVESGFESLEDWLKAIERLTGHKYPDGFLYRVRLFG